MNWKELLKAELDSSYHAAEKLLEKTNDRMLGWKPSAGSNWMTMGQLLMHLSSSCGSAFKGFITGDWGMPEGVDVSSLPPEEMLPPAEKMPSAGSVAETKELLQADRQTALRMLAHCSEQNLAQQQTAAPWDPTPMPLGRRLLQMIEHFNAHRGQLFYYLKLQGIPVTTQDYWGV